MNILHVANVYFVLPFFIGDQFKYFKNKGYNLYVVCSPSEYLHDYSVKQGFEYIESPVSRHVSLTDDLKSIYAIIRYARKKKIDIIVGHTPKGGLLSMIAGWLMRIPKRVYFRHGLVYETSHGLQRWGLMSADRIASFCATQIVCVSHSLAKKSIEDRLSPARKQIVLGKGSCNGVDAMHKFNPDRIDAQKLTELKRKYNINEGDYIIGFCGRLVRDKGIIPLIKAFDLLENTDNCKLLLVGMFEERDALPEEVKQRIMNDPKIIYTGLINGYMEYYYAMIDICVLPSYREGFPTVMLEAQSMGLPVLTTTVTGCCDSIVDGLTGLFITHDPEDIKNKIDDIRLNKAIDGKNGRKWVVENFNSPKIWAELEKIYR